MDEFSHLPHHWGYEVSYIGCSDEPNDEDFDGFLSIDYLKFDHGSDAMAYVPVGDELRTLYWRPDYREHNRYNKRATALLHQEKVFMTGLMQDDDYVWPNPDDFHIRDQAVLVRPTPLYLPYLSVAEGHHTFGVYDWCKSNISHFLPIDDIYDFINRDGSGGYTIFFKHRVVGATEEQFRRDYTLTKMRWG